ncbi:MAG: hypothetical protein CSA81_01500 [Acidobacteria bacterium]|nr:MAG: hypothetical protein CSA81_01500 [Acidobacteriota bacterium]
MQQRYQTEKKRQVHFIKNEFLSLLQPAKGRETVKPVRHKFTIFKPFCNPFGYLKNKSGEYFGCKLKAPDAR